MAKDTSTTKVHNDDDSIPMDYTLFYVVGTFLVIFYLVIMWILSSSESDRKKNLKKIKNPYRK